MLEFWGPKNSPTNPTPSFIFLLLLPLTIDKQMICFESSFHLILELFDSILCKISNVYFYFNQSTYGLYCINFFFYTYYITFISTFILLIFANKNEKMRCAKNETGSTAKTPEKGYVHSKIFLDCFYCFCSLFFFVYFKISI